MVAPTVLATATAKAKVKVTTSWVPTVVKTRNKRMLTTMMTEQMQVLMTKTKKRLVDPMTPLAARKAAQKSRGKPLAKSPP